MKKLFIGIVLCSFLFLPLTAHEESHKSQSSEHYSNKKVAYTTTINAIVTWPPQALVGVTQNFKVPLMQFDNPLTKDNNINFKIGAELSPISFEGKFGIVWTPIAFLEFYTESRVGSGWNIKTLYGLALNKNNAGKSNYIPLNFSKSIYSFSFGGAFQFDLGAVIPNDWSHVVFRTDQAALYKAMSGVDSETSWLYQADSGENRNGWKYQASYLIGYKMPIFLDLIAMKIDVEKKLFASPKGLDNKVWGENLFLTTFGPIINFNIKKDYNIMLLAQWQTKPLYKGGGEADFYQTKILDTDKKTQVKFYQVGIVFYMNINR
ncbi:hypothetical protein E4N85_08245 [Treponema denticola]|uniref:Protochlamydia outer membrane protein domain-containing protein n=1 Tax=Treponema denticola (strain ATCC 35405 / DSM 14222 / CIP 103919 / JCM 8153 / KCTC 15104) TaxID=243275 RepID=Q73P18_TREDE|nr:MULTISPECIES: hypothetical protein [Treponema]AAS11472.1 conserved hypothetical protein [Treponema denticola ATCC 35405]EMB33962.1 hypothetical protein HMPREF9721_02372 [Treponema denticola ATCC 35404]EMB36617.1 hypothetical protein HMPREF9735_01994 [Treponema denticola ATCC 33521]UTC95718.1 hypothetical protein E4N85_08245 [Treponema denticola]HCY93966.1 hypothetical protein [Treponema sp.]